MESKYKITGGSQGAVGDNAEAHHFMQTSNQPPDSVDLNALARELMLLRNEAKKQATEPEHDVAVGEIAAAETAAKKGDRTSAFTHLKSAGQWTLDVATKIGTILAAEILKKELGLK
jgi:hypothetical protein